MKHGIYFYNPLTRHLPCEQAKPLREHMKRLRVFSRALFASCESASRNSPAMRRRASALSAAFRSHPRESAMKPRTYFYNSITRHRPAKSPQSPRDRSLFSRTSLPSREPAMKHGIYFYNPLTRHLPCEQAKLLREHMKRLCDFSRVLFASFSSASRNSPAMRRRASALPAARRSHLREPAMKYGIYFYNPLTRHRPGKDPQSPRDRLLSSHTSFPSPRVSDETPNLFLQSINVALPLRTSQTVARTHEAPA